MKKIIFIISSAIITIILLTIIIVIITINLSKKNDNKVISYLENNINIVSTSNKYFDNTLTSMQINKKNYVGIIAINSLNISLPVKSRCSSLSSACYINKKPLSILTTNLSNSISNYKTLDIDDTISFTNLYGESFDFSIKDIKISDTLIGIDTYDADLIIVVKNYFDLEYTFLLCKFY